ncbi:MAG: hypothetical protein PVH29_00425 [Candidatus Zixiibacteriota bacterium]
MRLWAVILFLITPMIIPGVALGTNINVCYEDHDPLPNDPLPDKIGEVAGFQILSRFLSLGGFGCTDEVMNDIRAMNVEYLNNEYMPRHAEAVAIYEWLNTTHDVEYVSEFRDEANQKLARLHEISAEIDAIWIDYALTGWDMIPEDCQNAYIAWCAGLGTSSP